MIRDNPEQGNALLGEETQPDLETLEDQVIDSQMKLQAVSILFPLFHSVNLYRPPQT